MTLQEAMAALPRWDLQQDPRTGYYTAAEPNYRNTGLQVCAMDLVELVERARALVRVVELAAGRWPNRASPGPQRAIGGVEWSGKPPPVFDPTSVGPPTGEYPALNQKVALAKGYHRRHLQHLWVSRDGAHREVRDVPKLWFNRKLWVEQ